LKLKNIPQILVLNKADMLPPGEIDILRRQLLLDKPIECVAISAIHRESLKPLVEAMAVRIGKFEVTEDGSRHASMHSDGHHAGTHS
jgi:50S ribosomal subunit-associated GTPase HflX